MSREQSIGFLHQVTGTGTANVILTVQAQHIRPSSVVLLTVTLDAGELTEVSSTHTPPGGAATAVGTWTRLSIAAPAATPTDTLRQEVWLGYNFPNVLSNLAITGTKATNTFSAAATTLSLGAAPVTTPPALQALTFGAETASPMAALAVGPITVAVNETLLCAYGHNSGTTAATFTDTAPSGEGIVTRASASVAGAFSQSASREPVRVGGNFTRTFTPPSGPTAHVGTAVRLTPPAEPAAVSTHPYKGRDSLTADQGAAA